MPKMPYLYCMGYIVSMFVLIYVIYGTDDKTFKVAEVLLCIFLCSFSWLLCYVMLCYVMLCYVMLCYLNINEAMQTHIYNIHSHASGVKGTLN